MINDDLYQKYLDGNIIPIDGDVCKIRNIARIWLLAIKQIERLGLAEIGLEIGISFLELLDDDKSDLKCRVIHKILVDHKSVGVIIMLVTDFCRQHSSSCIDRFCST